VYYFVSINNFDGKTLYPRVPINRMDNEDESTERICVSQSIDGCLVATYYEVGDIVYVHTCEPNKVVTPTYKQVEDAPFTGEQWILEPVEMKLFIRLKITKRINRKLGGTNLPMDTYGYDIYNDDLDKLR
jgi:hypothetical protein